MRALGCIWNDFNDKKYDILVKRTKHRLVATGKVSNKEIIIFSMINLTVGILPILFIGIFSVFLCFLVLPLIISYPFMKRITWWPQLWLGLNFNWGILVGYYSVSEIDFNISVILFYIGSIFWTIAYDTIYGFQDIKYDLKIGVKSTAIKFKRNPKIFLLFNYLVCFVCWSSALFIKEHQEIIAFLTIIFIPMIFKIVKTNLSRPSECEKSFKSNSYFGFITTIFLIYLNIF